MKPKASMISLIVFETKSNSPVQTTFKLSALPYIGGCANVRRKSIRFSNSTDTIFSSSFAGPPAQCKRR
ncbi:hypothetical protein M378DRAFT_465676 [Amanita muscaria Koide BX008]|uniref:Uncharacterized protein n=1 Tax=Amanita muscaria (strain Koide BX008) TaxID=946122 RepID=A0A0C2WK74_AMAMK|nr:hypothetical protein M378DRAFT_465676 [Amanita muscaria Koide BX008]